MAEHAHDDYVPPIVSRDGWNSRFIAIQGQHTRKNLSH
jgi:hypothetical protein